MNQQRAIGILRKIIGPTFAYQLNPKAPNAEQRAAIRAELQTAKAAAEAAEAARVARLQEILAADEQYQALKAEAVRTKKAKDAAGDGLYSYRITVGCDKGWCFSVVAEADNWAEVVGAVTEKAA